MSADRWVTGDHFGLPIPADPAALHSGGAAFLTEAFRTSGALDAGNAVTRISQFDEVPGGSTGRKLLLTVEYDKPGTHTDLFVKFSRDFDDPIRDRGKTQMESEVLFASLSREPGFPITVPATQFADYHRDTGTGLLISERIQLGANGIERQYHKCLDYEMPEPLEHYRALVSALGRLVGGHRSGRIPAGDQFPVDMQTAQVGERAPISAEKLDRRLGQLADFAETSPGLLPANVRSPQFISRLRDDAPRFLATRARGVELSGRSPGLHRAVPLERQRRQRLVLARQRQRPALRLAGLGLRRPDERGHGVVGRDVGRRDRPVGSTTSTSCCACSSPRYTPAAGQISA